jgi:hypothetical protein
MDETDGGSKPDQADSDPRPAAVTFVTTEHFTLQGARSSTIAESTGRAGVFLQAVSGGLVALGLVATAAAALTGLMRYQNSAWIRGTATSLFPGAAAGPH